MKAAMKAGNSKHRLVLSGLLSAIQNKELEKRTKLSKTEHDITKLVEESQLAEDEALQVIGTEAKKRRESIEAYGKGGRNDLAEQEQAELDIITAYLPAQMADEDLRAVVAQTVKDSGATTVKDIGKVMSVVMAKVKGRADGQRVSAMVQEALK